MTLGLIPSHPFLANLSTFSLHPSTTMKWLGSKRVLDARYDYSAGEGNKTFSGLHEGEKCFLHDVDLGRVLGSCLAQNAKLS